MGITAQEIYGDDYKMDYYGLEEEHNKMVQRKWGRRVVKYDFTKSINPRVHIPTARSGR